MDGETKVIFLDINNLKPYPNNPRKHSDEQIALLVGSLNEFGWTRPILTDENGVILAGHGAWEAAKARGDDKVPVLIKAGLTAKQKSAYIIADNKLAERSTWDMDILKTELSELVKFDSDLFEITGFRDFELRDMLGNVGHEGEDNLPDKVVKRCQPGQLWTLGKHRLLCGDSTKAEDVTRLLNGANPHLMVTDPPYGVGYDAKHRLDSGINKQHQKRAEKKITNDDRIDWSEAYNLFPGGVAYIWHAGRHASEVQRSLEVAGFIIRCQIIWVKNSLVIGRGHYHWRHEPCWYAVRKNHGKWYGGRKQSTVWEIENMHRTQGSVDDGKTELSSQKPVECMRRPILNNSKRGDAVYDPFIGSGTTIIACEDEGRICYAMDIDPDCCDITIQRYENYTGKKAMEL